MNVGSVRVGAMRVGTRDNAVEDRVEVSRPQRADRSDVSAMSGTQYLMQLVVQTRMLDAMSNHPELRVPVMDRANALLRDAAARDAGTTLSVSI